MADLATAEVSLEVDFANLEPEVRAGLEERVKRAARSAQKELDKTTLAAAALGDTIKTAVGGEADKAAAKIRKSARSSAAELDRTGRAASAAGKRIAGATDAAAASVARVADLGARGGASIGRLLDRLGEIEPATRRPARGIGRISASLVSVAALAAAVAPAAVAGGAGVAAFAAIALPSIARVIQAQTEMSERWESLTDDEKVAALQTKALVDRFKELSAELSPQALQVYNGALGTLEGLLPRLRPLFDGVLASLRDTNQELGRGLDSARAQDFFDFLGREAGPAVDAVTQLLISFAAAGVSVVQALAPLAATGVGVLTFLADLLALVGEVSPELLQFVTILIALRGPLSALGTFFTNAGNKATAFAKETKGAALAARGLALAQAGIPGLILAGATALVFFAVQLSKTKTDADRLADSINAANRAAGNNLDGYREANKIFATQLAPSTARITAALGEFRKEQSLANVEILKGQIAAQSLNDTNVAAINAQERNNVAIANIKAGAAALAAQYGITTAQAIQLADAVGINLSKNILNSGVVTASVTDKINAYSSSVLAAADPTTNLSNTLSIAANGLLELEDRITALTAALNQQFAPTLALFSAQNRLAEVNKQANKVLKDRNATEVERRTALERSLGQIRTLAEAEFAAKQSVTASSAALEAQLPKLTRLAGTSKTGRAAIKLLRDALSEMQRQSQTAGGKVDSLGRKINDLPKKKDITIGANTTPAQSAFDSLLARIGIRREIPIGIRAPGATGGLVLPGAIARRRGGPVGLAGGGILRGPGTGTSDSIPAVIDRGRGGLAALSTGEYVINARATRRHFALIQAINRGKFAAGGYIGRAAGRLRAFAAGGAVRGYATGGKVDRASRRSLVNIGALLGDAITAGLRGSRRAIEKEADKIRKSLETKIVAIGQTVGTGFFQRITGSPAEINSAFTSLEKQIARAFAGIRTRVDDLLIARLERLNDRLATLAKRRDALAASIEKATQLAATVAERTRASASIPGFADDQRTSAENIAKTLRDRLTKIRQFQRDIGTLTRRGLDKGIIQELVEGGPDANGELARTLARAGAGALREINSLQKKIDRSAARFGRDTADALFDAGKEAGRGFLTGLKAQRKEIIALMTEIAKSVAKTVKDTLKIKSPSVVLKGLAVDTMTGYIEGVRKLATQVRASVAAAVRPDAGVRRAATVEPTAPAAGSRRAPTSSPAPSTTAADRSVTVNQTNTFNQVIADPDQIIAVTDSRLVAALRGA